MITASRSFFFIFPMMAFAALLAGCDQAEKQADASKAAPIRPVKTITVRPEVSKFQRTYSAVVLPSQEVELSFRVSGRIVELAIRSGLKVKKGDIVAQLDTRDFKAEITQLESQLEQAEAQMQVMTSGARAEDIASLQAAVAAAQAQVDAAKDQVARSRQLFNRQVVAKARLDNDLTSLRVAEAELKAKEQELIKGRAGARQEDVATQEAVIRGLKSQLKSLNDKLSDTTLRVPFDGIIAIRKVENFSNIQAKEAIATLQNLSSPNLTFDVPGPDVYKLAKFKELDLKVVLDSIPDHEFEATRGEFSTQADAATQTYRARVAIQNPDGEPILPGMTGSLIVTARQEGAAVFMLPISAIASEADGKPFVWIVNTENNKTARRGVVTGQASGANIVVSEGLEEGDVVVTAGISALQESMVVRPVSAIGE
ncbi:MAG: efflux RND transporter periplasmic adaptor subunit [Alphaproteobacteria bacterium]|nr:efflux RND transporter periplasmic adaptor subunit [Alphaproteobacteria bacterium]